MSGHEQDPWGEKPSYENADELFADVKDDAELASFSDAGDRVDGELVAVERKPGKFSQTPFPWLTLSTEDGLVKVACSSFDLQRKMLKEIKAKSEDGRIKLGAMVSIEFTGERSLANGKTAKEFAVSYEPPKAGA